MTSHVNDHLYDAFAKNKKTKKTKKQKTKTKTKTKQKKNFLMH